jgi:hypothetical protein
MMAVAWRYDLVAARRALARVASTGAVAGGAGARSHVDDWVVSTLHKSLLDVVDTESGLVRRDNVVVDDRGQAKGNIVLGHANLLWDFGGLNLDINLEKSLAERIDLDQTGVNSLVELSELGNETNVALVDFLVRVGTNDAAGNSAHSSDDTSEDVHHASIPVIGTGLVFNNSRILALEIFLLGRLDRHLVLRDETSIAFGGCMRVFGSVGGSGSLCG